MRKLKLFFACLLMAVLSIGQVWGANWNKITNLSELSNGDSVLVVIQDGKTLTSGKAIKVGGTTSANKEDVTITSNSYISDPANSTKWAVNSSTSSNVTTYTFTNGNSNKIRTGSTTNNKIGGNASGDYYTWYITKLSDGYFKVQCGGSDGMYISWTGSIFGKYANSNFVNQMTLDPAVNLAANHGAVSFYKKASTSSYTITAQSNNTNYGTVSLSGSVITGSPKSGYRYASPAYSVSPANSATVSQNGNAFTVTPSANTTVTINFEAMQSASISFVNEGTPAPATTGYYVGDTYELPSTNNYNCNGKTFVGWSTVVVDETNTKPSSNFYEPGAEVTLTASQTFYAVFATLTGTVNEYKKGTTADLTEGQKVIIVNTATNKAMSGASFNSPVDVSPSSNKFSTTSSNIIWTVKKSNTSSAFKYGDSYLTLLTSNPYINLISTPDYFTTSGSGPYILTSGVNTGKSLEYYNGKFTGYNTGTGDAFNMDFYIPNWSYSTYSTDCAAPSCENPTIAFAEVGPINKLTTAAAFTNAATATLNDNPTGQTITYSGDNDAVAEVNSTTGEVTINGVGTVHITATAAEVANTYCEASESYTLVVSEPTHEYQYTHDFTALDISGWGNSYDERDAIAYNIYDGHDGNDDQVKFMGASSQSTIDNMPVIKGAAVNLVMLDNMKYISAVKFVCQQWTNKAQTKEIKYSTNGGTTWSSLDPAVSNSFTSSTTGATMKVECLTLPANVNAIQLYGTGTNQIGIASVSFDLADKVIVKKAVTITAPAAAEGTLVVKNAGVAITSGDEIEVGTSLTIEAEANDGYSLSAISVKDESNNDVEVTSNTFVVPSKNVTVSATFVVDARPQPVIAIDNMALTFTQVATITPTVTGAASASDVTYEIKAGSDDCITLEGSSITAKSVEGTATIVASIAGTTDYKPATREFTVTVSDPRYKAERTAFTALEGKVATVSAGTHKDKEYISYATFKGTGTTDPKAENNILTFYKPASGKSTGGYIMISAVKGCTIDEVQVTNAGSKSTTIGCSTTSTLATSGTAYGLNATVSFTSLNSSVVYIDDIGSERVDITKLVVYYTGEPISVKSIALSGTYQTEFTKNATFNHDGVVVTATYSDDSQADVTTLAEFSDPDMSTIGQKEITVSYGGKSTSYNIEVVAATLTEIAISGTYPTRFNVGDEFSHAGMTVTATYSDFSEEDVTNDATFSGYNMAVGGIQTVTVEYGGQSAQYSIIVVPANTDVITAADLEATSTQYKAFSGVTDLGTSAVYAGKTAKSSEGAIQVRTSKSEDGIVVTGQNGTKVVKSVAIDFATVPTSPKVLEVYGKHTAYSSAADLFDDGAKGDLIGSLGEDGSVDCTAANYEFIGIRSSDGAMYLASVMVTWGDAVIPPTVYTVTFNTDGGSPIDPVEVEEGQAVAKPADPTKDDYNFVEWQLNGVAYDFTAAVTANITLDAVWEPVTPPTPDYETVRGGLEINRYYTICLKKKIIAVKGATFWNLNKRDEGATVAYLEEASLPFPAGTPYIFQATNDNEGKLEVVYEGGDVENPVTNGALRGRFTDLDQAGIDDAATAESSDIYMLKNNELRQANGRSGNTMKAYKAYIVYGDLTPVSTSPLPAPGKRVKSMPMEPQVTTDIDNVQGDNVQCTKVLIDGQLFILRGEKLYDATGRLVK